MDPLVKLLSLKGEVKRNAHRVVNSRSAFLYEMVGIISLTFLRLIFKGIAIGQGVQPCYESIFVKVFLSV